LSFVDEGRRFVFVRDLVEMVGDAEWSSSGGLESLTSSNVSYQAYPISRRSRTIEKQRPCLFRHEVSRVNSHPLDSNHQDLRVFSPLHALPLRHRLLRDQSFCVLPNIDQLKQSYCRVFSRLQPSINVAASP
jgi:hypothetical protein